MANSENNHSRKNIFLIICSIIVLSVIVFAFILNSLKNDTESYRESKLNYSDSNDDSYSSSNDDFEGTTDDEDNYFNDLEITNVSIVTTKYDGWNSVVGEVKNNSDKTLSGYLDVAFYSTSGELVDTVPAHFGPLSPGQTGTFDAPGTKQPAVSCKVLSGNILDE